MSENKRDIINAARRAKYVSKRKPPLDIIPLTIGTACAVIHLTKGLHTLVDIRDWKYLTKYKWMAHRGRPGHEVYYASRTTSRPTRYLFMHNAIMSPTPGMFVDHINRNRLDNRRCNLRLCIHSENMANRPRQNKTGFRGVHVQTSGRFQALICGKGLGTFSTPEEAAKAFDAAAKEKYGEFATTNF